MQTPESSPSPHNVVGTRGPLTGAIVSGIFGIAWAQWGASGLSGAVTISVRVVAIVIGVVIVARSARLLPSAPAESAPMFGSRAYRLVVVAEVAALVAGAIVLNSLGHSAYIVAWFAAVVGVHFIMFGRLFHAHFYLTGVAVLLAGVASAVVGLAGGGRNGTTAVCGLIAAASLLAAGGWRVLRAGAEGGP